jgi:MFS family permease
VRRSIRVWWREVEPWYVVASVACLVQGTASVLIPLAVSTVLGRSVASLGVLSSLVSFVGVVGSLTWGRLADAAYRRKPVLVLSYAMVPVSSAWRSLARSSNSPSST